MTRQKNKRLDSKVESNDSPEIPDKGETSYIPCLLWRLDINEFSNIKPSNIFIIILMSLIKKQKFK